MSKNHLQIKIGTYTHILGLTLLFYKLPVLRQNWILCSVHEYSQEYK